MKTYTTEEILIMCDDWMNNAKIERKGMMVEIPNPSILLNTKYVRVDDVIKEIDNTIDRLSVADEIKIEDGTKYPVTLSHIHILESFKKEISQSTSHKNLYLDTTDSRGVVKLSRLDERKTLAGAPSLETTDSARDTFIPCTECEGQGQWLNSDVESCEKCGGTGQQKENLIHYKLNI